MKKNVSIGLVSIVVIAMIAVVSIYTQGASYVYDSIEKLFNRMVESSADHNSLKVEFVNNALADFSVHNETALTATIDPSLQVRHTTTGTPANGIGVSIDYKQETSVGNEEIIARMAGVMTDVTGASEDADYVLYLMDAGTAAERLRVDSDGMITMRGGATIDNNTSAANLAIAETNIGLTGVMTLTGATTIAGATTVNGAVVINETSADVDTRIESNDVATAFVVDAGKNTVEHGSWDVYKFIKNTAQSYSLASTGRAANIMSTVGEASNFMLMTELLTTPGAGAVITIKTGDTSDVTIGTEGAEDIDGADTYVLDGALESVTLTNDGVNWFILGGYLE